MSKWVEVCGIKSSTSKYKIYSISVNSESFNLSCSCEAWHYSEDDPKACKHTRTPEAAYALKKYKRSLGIVDREPHVIVTHGAARGHTMTLPGGPTQYVAITEAQRIALEACVKEIQRFCTAGSWNLSNVWAAAEAFKGANT